MQEIFLKERNRKENFFCGVIILLIKKADPNDAEKLLEIYSYYVEKTAISFECEVPSVEEFRSRIENVLKKFPFLVAEIHGQIVGYAYAHEFVGREAYKYSAELTIYLDKNFRKRKIGGTLYRELEKILKTAGFTNLYACVGFPEVEDEFLTMNSVNFHEHLGFKIVGKFFKCGCKFGRRYSMVWLEKIISEV